MLQALLGFVGPESNDSQSKAAGTNGSFRKKRFHDRSLLRFWPRFGGVFLGGDGLGIFGSSAFGASSPGSKLSASSAFRYGQPTVVWLLPFFNQLVVSGFGVWGTCQDNLEADLLWLGDEPVNLKVNRA